MVLNKSVKTVGKKSKLGGLYAVILLVFSGCVVTPEVPLEQAASINSVPIEEDNSDKQESQEIQQHIADLLFKAQQALKQDRLKRPTDDNAYFWLQQVLALDELNPEAHSGMRAITQRYFELAEQAFKQGRRNYAELLLSRAMSVSATPNQVDQIRQKYPEDVAANIYPLSTSALVEKGETITKQLADIAALAVQKESRLLIVARNDAEGRWIYKQMRASVDGYRLRGNIEIGANARIVLIDL